MSMEVHSFDFTNGAKVSKIEIQKWHTEAVEKIRSGEANGWWSINSGNSLIIARKMTFSHDLDNPVIVLYEITNGFVRYEYSDVDFKSEIK